MELPINTFKRALKAGKAPIGLWCTLSSHYAIEVVAGAGFDWLLLDTEHSPNELDMVLTQLQAAAAYPTHPVVRVPWNDMVTIKRFLDIGAQSVAHSLRIERRGSPECCRLHSLSGRRRARHGWHDSSYPFRPSQGLCETAHEELCVLVQIETQAGSTTSKRLSPLTEWMSFIGPADLHASLGYAGETANPQVKPIIDEGIRRIRNAGKAPGILTSDEANARHWLELGCQFVAVGSDIGILARESEKFATKFKVAAKEQGK